MSDPLVCALRGALAEPSPTAVGCAYSVLAGAHVTLEGGDTRLIGYEEAAVLCVRAFGGAPPGIGVIRSHDDPEVVPVRNALLAYGIRTLTHAPRPSWRLGADRACLHVALLRPLADPAAAARVRAQYVSFGIRDRDPLGDWAFG